MAGSRFLSLILAAAPWAGSIGRSRRRAAPLTLRFATLSALGVGAAQRRGVLPRADQGLHLRADLPRRELERQPPPRRVLDDRAGDRVRRPLGQCGIGGSAA